MGRDFPGAADLTPDSSPRKFEAFAIWSDLYENIQFQITLKKL